MPADADIRVCGLVVRPHERLVSVHGHDVELTSREFDIVLRLAQHPGWVLSADQLCSEEDDADYSPESVSVLISRLRHKLAEAGAGDVIETVRGAGYRLRAPRRPDERAETALSVSADALHDAFWRLQEVVLEADHSGTDEQKKVATDVLGAARQAIRDVLTGQGR